MCQCSGRLGCKWEGSERRLVFQEICRRWEEKGRERERESGERGKSCLSGHPKERMILYVYYLLCLDSLCLPGKTRQGSALMSSTQEMLITTSAKHLLHIVKTCIQICYSTHHSASHFGVCLWIGFDLFK